MPNGIQTNKSLIVKLIFASPSKQFSRVKHILWLAKCALLGVPDQFPGISMQPAGNVYRANFDDGFVWHVTKNDKALAAWASAFINLRCRFEDSNLIGPGDVVVNVGACSGEYTKYAAESVGESGKVYALEPDPAHFECLVENMRHYGLTWVEAVQAGASNNSGSLQLHRIENAMAGGSVDNSYRENYQDRITSSSEIAVHRLDELFANLPTIHCLVVTVNGHELEVLQGAKDLMPNIHHVIYQSENHFKCAEYLQSEGFRMDKEIMQNNGSEAIALFSR